MYRRRKPIIHRREQSSSVAEESSNLRGKRSKFRERRCSPLTAGKASDSIGIPDRSEGSLILMSHASSALSNGSGSSCILLCGIIDLRCTLLQACNLNQKGQPKVIVPVPAGWRLYRVSSCDDRVSAKSADLPCRRYDPAGTRLHDGQRAPHNPPCRHQFRNRPRAESIRQERLLPTRRALDLYLSGGDWLDNQRHLPEGRWHRGGAVSWNRFMARILPPGWRHTDHLCRIQDEQA
jgi:hypothetical protein